MDLSRMHLQWFSDPPPDPPPAGPPAGPKPGDQVPVAYASQLSPEQRKDARLMEALKAHPKMSDLVRHWDESQQRLSRAIIVPNAEHPDPAEVKSFREALGLPEKPEEYPLDLAAYKEVEDAEEIAALVRQKAFDMSLSKPQAQKLLDALMGMSKAGREQLATARKEAAEIFDARLLEAVGKDEKKAQAAKNLMTAFMVKHVRNEALIRKIADSGLLYDPTFALVAAEIAGKLGEERLVGGGSAAEGGAKAPAQGSQGHYSTEWEQTHGKRQQKGA